MGIRYAVFGKCWARDSVCIAASQGLGDKGGPNQPIRKGGDKMKYTLRTAGLWLVLAALWRAIGVIDEDIRVASGADKAVNRLAELLMLRLTGGVLAAGRRSAHSHLETPHIRRI